MELFLLPQNSPQQYPKLIYLDNKNALVYLLGLLSLDKAELIFSAWRSIDNAYVFELGKHQKAIPHNCMNFKSNSAASARSHAFFFAAYTRLDERLI